MSLEKYIKKRTFSKTPEPKGVKLNESGKDELIFVVQKHQASHLHYDFRLEREGVLKSWSVPKGPTMETEEKRLAVAVEDHPLEYAKFSGIIPEGNYGAGVVENWDKGTYDPIKFTDDHIEVNLKGKKLKGVFALIKMRKGFSTSNKDKKENNWLLFKKNENSLRSETDKDKMPHKVRPMLTTLIDKPFNKKGWGFEVKWDGYRAIAEVSNNKVNLYSRNGISYENKFPSIVEDLIKIPHEMVVDGEIVVIGDNGIPVFQALQNYSTKKGELVYYVFDLLYLDGRDLQNKPLVERRKLLSDVIPRNSSVIFSESVERSGVSFFKAASGKGLEGIVAKNEQSKYYQNVRSRDWLKIKTYKSQEAVICGFTEPRRSRQKFGSLLLGVYEAEKLKFIGHVGSGFNEESLTSIYKKITPIKQKECPFDSQPNINTKVSWVKPKFVCEVKFSEWTAEGLLRHPVFLRLRDDKNLKSAKEEKVFSQEPPENTDDWNLVINEQNLKITHPSKVFWPDEGYTKRDLIEYYRLISPIILPYLKDRPESLLRFPDGIKGKSFYHKDLEIAPDWVSSIDIKSGDKDISYILCQNEQTLIYMISLGCIDLNPWSSRVTHLENPDYLILDLDPEKVSFESVVTVALEIKKVLDQLNIVGYPKTSGATGIHIYIPLGAKYDYEQVRMFAQIIAQKVYESIPEITSLERSPDKRQGKVYIDVYQNARGQTLASPYSVRAQKGATVSTPLAWNEVNHRLKPSMFDIKNIFERVKEKGDIFRPIMEEGINIEKSLNKLL